MGSVINKKIELWTNPPYDASTVAEIKQLLSENNKKELEDRFYTQLDFGTGGLRGVIGAGTNRMNIYTVGMATQGLSNYIAAAGCSDKGVVIARDSRRMSDEFARETAEILAGNGIRVYFFEDITPTPLCSFAIRELKTASGVVITASHNPPEYNGYKVYWDDGGQIVPPQDREIIDEVKKILSISEIKKIKFSDGVKSGLIKLIGRDILNKYISALGEKITKRSSSTIKIVYTPIHGTGYKIVPEVLGNFGYNNLITVREQSIPDGNFPTVESPNPEEKSALKMALELASDINADIVLATDPDSDRMGVAIRDTDGGFILLNGNQIGVLLEYYLLSKARQMGELGMNPAVIKTIVTTDLQRDIAESFGCRIDEVLTGFKWIASKMKEYDSKGISYIFGGEESFGYLPINFVRDKDAVSSCCFFAEMAQWAADKRVGLNGILKEIYLKYGLYLDDLYSITLKGIEGIEKIKELMSKFRKNPPAQIADMGVVTVMDYKALHSLDIVSGTKHIIEDIPPSDVLQFILSDGSKISMRPSGTEPKIKFYFSVKLNTSEGTYKDDLGRIKEKLAIIKETFIKSIDI